MSHYWPREDKRVSMLWICEEDRRGGCGWYRGQNEDHQTSAIPEVLGAVGGIGAGVGIGLLGVYAAGTTGLSAVGIIRPRHSGAAVGGGMVAGIFVAVARWRLGLTGYGLLKWRYQQKLRSKKALFQDALRKRDAIQRELKEKVDMADERTRYLDALNIKLREVIENLEQDLGKKEPALELWRDVRFRRLEIDSRRAKTGSPSYGNRTRPNVKSRRKRITCCPRQTNPCEPPSLSLPGTELPNLLSRQATKRSVDAFLHYGPGRRF